MQKTALTGAKALTGWRNDSRCSKFMPSKFMPFSRDLEAAWAACGEQDPVVGKQYTKQKK